MLRSGKSMPEPSSRGLGWGRGLLWVLLFALVGGGSYGVARFAFFGSFFAVGTIEISGLVRAGEEDLLRFMGVEEGMNLLVLDADRIRGRAERHPWVRTAVVRKRLPDRLVIEIRERAPVAALQYAAWDRLHGIDDEGYVLPQLSLEDLRPDPSRREEDLILVTGLVGELLVGAPLPDGVRPAAVGLVTLLRDSPSLAGKISEIRRTPGGLWKASARDRTKEIVFGPTPTEFQVELLRQTWAFLESRNVRSEYIDLRNPAQGVILRPVGTTLEKWVDIEKGATARRGVS